MSQPEHPEAPEREGQGDAVKYTVTFMVGAPADPDLDEFIEDAIRHYLLLEQWLVQTNAEIEADKIEYAPLSLNEESIAITREGN